MNFTAENLDSFVENLNQEEIYDDVTDTYVTNPNYDEDAEPGWMNVYYESTGYEMDTPWGKLVNVKSWGGEGDGAETHLVVLVGDRLFQKDGYYSSWGESAMDSALVEVEAYVEPTTYYRKK